MKDTNQNVISQYKKVAYSTPLLKKGEEFELIQKYKESAGQDHETKQKLISAYLRTVINLAEKYSYRNRLDPLDLIQCGIVGILNSLEKFDLSEYKKITKNSGSLFAYFTYRAILMEMQDHYRNNIRQVSVSDSTNNRLTKINKLYKNEKLNDKTPEEIVEIVCESLAVKKKEAVLLLSLFSPGVELDKPLENDSDGDDTLEYKDFILKTYDEESPAAIYKNVENKNFLLKNIDKLEKEERFVILNKYGIKCEKKSVEEIAGLLNKSSSYIVIRMKRAQEKLKNMIKSENIEKVW